MPGKNNTIWNPLAKTFLNSLNMGRKVTMQVGRSKCPWLYSLSKFQHVSAPKPVSCFFIKLLFTVGRRLWFHFEYKIVTTGKKKKKVFKKVSPKLFRV